MEGELSGLELPSYRLERGGAKRSGKGGKWCSGRLEEVVFSGGGQTTDVNEVDTKQPLPLLALFPRMGTRERGSQRLSVSWTVTR